ncbi:MAG: DUF1559 domain-containing protein, partial [Planctomycetota bacterium]
PALSRAREAARQVSCKNNMKNIGTAWIMYHQMHSGYVTKSTQQYYGVPAANDKVWATVLCEQLDIPVSSFTYGGTDYFKPNGGKLEGLFYCPSFDARATYDYYVPYGMPQFGIGGRTYNNDYRGLEKIASLDQPSQKFLLLDSVLNVNDGKGSYRIFDNGTYTHARHIDQTNITCADGHVESSDKDSISLPYADMVWRDDGPWASFSR